jgi:hypothetical protein
MKNPLLSAAILRICLMNAKGSLVPAYRFMYRGILKDYNLSDAEVKRYIKEHQEEVEQICNEKGIRYRVDDFR